MREMKRARSGAVLCAVLLLSGLGLTGCGDDEAVNAEPTTVDGGGSGAAGGEAAEPETAEQPEGEPLPDDWPAEFLVPDGTIVLVMDLGGGYSVTVEGVDSDQAQGLIDEMIAAGLSTTAGVTDTGNGEWIAEVVGGTHRASYAYAGGGAGLPNVTIMLTPNA